MDTSGEDRHTYIRTFEGDMETLKEGGTPELSPLPKASTPSEPVKEETSTPPAPEPPPVEAPTETPAPPAPPQDPLKTYAGDFSERIQETKASTATILAADQDARGVPQQEVAPSSHRSLVYGIIGGLLFLVGAGAIYAAYVFSRAEPAPVVVQTSFVPIVAEETVEVGATQGDLLGKMRDSLDHSLADGAVRIFTLPVAASTTNVFAIVAPSAPDILLRNIRSDRSVAGVVAINGVQSPFFILSVSSYGNTFSGMLSWESRIRIDLQPLFPPYTEPAPAVVVTATSTASTTPKAATVATSTATTTPTKTPAATSSTVASTTPPAVEPTSFADDTIANHDVRIYRDSKGRSVIVYGYWNPETLVIARDQAAFSEILTRLASSRAQP